MSIFSLSYCCGHWACGEVQQLQTSVRRLGLLLDWSTLALMHQDC